MFVEVVVLELAETGALLSYEALYLQTPKEWNGANVCPVPRLIMLGLSELRSSGSRSV